ncbi:transposase InsO family protein, partial [Bacillus horti]|nr:transposase InsO family protein [Bacillus horti]
LHLKSVCRRKRKTYIQSTPQVTAENILNREFDSTEFGTKWLTDVTEMKYGTQSKAYLSAILDLADKSIVSFVIGHSNNNDLVLQLLIWLTKPTQMLGLSFIVIVVSSIRAKNLRRN